MLRIAIATAFGFMPCQAIAQNSQLPGNNPANAPLPGLITAPVANAVTAQPQTIPYDAMRAYGRTKFINTTTNVPSSGNAGNSITDEIPANDAAPVP